MKWHPITIPLLGLVLCVGIAYAGTKVLSDGDEVFIINGNLTVGGSLYADEINLGDSPEVTIASDAITKTKGNLLVDTESDASTDDLSTINGGKPGDRLILRAVNGARSVVIKDSVGNIETVGDFVLDNTQDTFELLYDGTSWVELSRANNGA